MEKQQSQTSSYDCDMNKLIRKFSTRENVPHTEPRHIEDYAK